ncbi:MAG: hypothetical protein ACYCZY_13185 [Lacisediminihabitans sp.]
MATLALQNVRVTTGKVVTYSAASAGGDRVAPGSDVFLHVRNASAAPVTVTLDATGTAFNSAAIPDTVLSVPAAGDLFVPVTAEYRSVTDGLAAVAYSASASVTVAALTV